MSEQQKSIIFIIYTYSSEFSVSSTAMLLEHSGHAGTVCSRQMGELQ